MTILRYFGVTILKTTIRPGVLPVFFIAALTSQAYAIATYTYTGNNYTFAESPFTTSMNVTGSFIVATALPADLALTDIRPQLLSLNFSDGIGQYDLADQVLIFSVGTDGAGNIDEWNIFLATPFPTKVGERSHRVQTINLNTSLWDVADFFECLAGEASGCTDFSSFFEAENREKPGDWTVRESSVPEPASLVLLLSGIAGLGLLRRFRENR